MSGTYTKRKKHRSFLGNAKKYGRRGLYGKGSNLSEEEYNYYIRIYRELKLVENEQRDVLVKNVLEELIRDGNMKLLVTNQIVSRMLDDILPLAPLPEVITFLKVFSEDLRSFCIDQFASHVLQTLLVLSLKYIQVKIEKQTENTDGDEQGKNEFETFLLKTSKFVYNNLEDFVCQTYASHVVRSVLEVCSGTEVSASIKSSQVAQTSHSIKENSKESLNVPHELSSLVEKFITRLTQLPNFSDVIGSNCGSAVLQTALTILISTNDTQSSALLVHHVIDHGFNTIVQDDHSNIHPLFEMNSTCRLMEVTLMAATPEQQDLLFASFFKENLPQLVSHRLAIHAVQKLFTSWKNAESFPIVYKSGESLFEKAVQEGQTALIRGVACACRRLQCKQKRFGKTLMKILGCFSSEASQLKLPLLLLYFLPLEEYEEKRNADQLPASSLNGTLILQDLFHFKTSDGVIKGLLTMSVEDLVKLACDPKGSHVVDAFTTSPSVTETNITALIKRLKGNMVTLACSTFGSRSLESLWNRAGVEMKTTICNALIEKISVLEENKYGLIIRSKFELDEFIKGGRKNWEEIQQQKSRKRDFLSKMLEETDEVTLPIKKKKKKF